LEPVERPGAERQAPLLGVGQPGGEDLGDLLRGVGRRAARAGLIRQGRGALGVKASDPGGDGGPGDAQAAGDRTGPLALGGGENDPGSLDEAGLCGTGVGEFLDGLTLLGRQFSECDLGLHGCTSLPGTLIIQRPAKVLESPESLCIFLCCLSFSTDLVMA
jgi:hypothetical protein